jgi:hypothetical protein
VVQDLGPEFKPQKKKKNATQEDSGLKPAWAKSSRNSISKKPITKKKKGLTEWLKW